MAVWSPTGGVHTAAVLRLRRLPQHRTGPRVGAPHGHFARAAAAVHLHLAQTRPGAAHCGGHHRAPPGPLQGTGAVGHPAAHASGGDGGGAEPRAPSGHGRQRTPAGAPHS
eukprot:4561553-Pyramimonas_sp.AAC.1